MSCLYKSQEYYKLFLQRSLYSNCLFVVVYFEVSAALSFGGALRISE